MRLRFLGKVMRVLVFFCDIKLFFKPVICLNNLWSYGLAVGLRDLSCESSFGGWRPWWEAVGAATFGQKIEGCGLLDGFCGQEREY